MIFPDIKWRGDLGLGTLSASTHEPPDVNRHAGPPEPMFSHQWKGFIGPWNVQYVICIVGFVGNRAKLPLGNYSIYSGRQIFWDLEQTLEFH